jgi:hypothetical protein
VKLRSSSPPQHLNGSLSFQKELLGPVQDIGIIRCSNTSNVRIRLVVGAFISAACPTRSMSYSMRSFRSWRERFRRIFVRASEIPGSRMLSLSHHFAGTSSATYNLEMQIAQLALKIISFPRLSLFPV